MRRTPVTSCCSDRSCRICIDAIRQDLMRETQRVGRFARGMFRVVDLSPNYQPQATKTQEESEDVGLNAPAV